MELKIFLRHTQMYALFAQPNQGIQHGSPIVYRGANPSVLQPVNGNVPQQVYKDFTADCLNLQTFEITFSTERGDDGAVNEGEDVAKKTASGTLAFTDEAYKFIKRWLIDDVAAPFNSIDVKVEHVWCGKYEELIIKPNQVQWCEDDVCEVQINLQQKDPAIRCLEQSITSDNWQGWFHDETKKKHPRFLYCLEHKPNGVMVFLWWLITMFAYQFLLITPIIWIIQSLVFAVRWIITLLSLGSVRAPDTPQWYNPLETVEALYMEASGCGRLHPAPLVRDYIDNICKKCNVHVDSVSSPIFHSKFKRGGGGRNPYYNVTYLNAPVKKGLHAFRGVFGRSPNVSQFYIEKNRPVQAFDLFLDELKEVFNAAWRVKRVNGQPTLYFWRKDWFADGQAIYNFKGADRAKILHGICYDWSDKQMPVFIEGLYSQDAQDSAGNEVLGQSNDVVVVGDGTNNPLYKGKLDKTSFNFGAARFRFDGASDDYLTNALQVILNFGALPVISSVMVAFFSPFLVRLRKLLHDYADYVLIMSSDNVTLPKLIIWDEASGTLYSRAVKKFAAHPNGGTEPFIYPYYNSEAWHEKNKPDTFVKGSGLSLATYPAGIYKASDSFGVLTYEMPAMLVNYPMYFAAGYKDNLWENFHEIDDPRKYPNRNLNWEVDIELCCEDLQKLKVFDDANEIVLNGKVLLPLAYYPTGTISEITVNYDVESNLGASIKLKGRT